MWKMFECGDDYIFASSAHAAAVYVFDYVPEICLTLYIQTHDQCFINTGAGRIIDVTFCGIIRSASNYGFLVI